MSMKQAPSYLSMFGFLFGLYMGYQINPGDQLSDDSVKSCFTPGENCTALIVQHIDNAKSEIRVQAYSFTSPPIIDALIRARQRGVKVRILIDKSNKDKMNVEPLLPLTKAFGNDIKIDILPGIAHNKVMVIDDIVITGSFNFTKAAQHRNAENVLILKNKTIHSRYYANWEKRNKLAFDPNTVADHMKVQSVLQERANTMNRERRQNYRRANNNIANNQAANNQALNNQDCMNQDLMNQSRANKNQERDAINRTDSDSANRINNSHSADYQNGMNDKRDQSLNSHEMLNKESSSNEINNQNKHMQEMSNQVLGIHVPDNQKYEGQTVHSQQSKGQEIDNQQFNEQ